MWTIFLHFVALHITDTFFIVFSHTLVTFVMDDTYRYSPRLSVDPILSNPQPNLHRPNSDEPRTSWASRVHTVGKVWLEAFTNSTVLRISHV